MRIDPGARQARFKVEALEGRQLLAATVFHPPAGDAPVQVAAASTAMSAQAPTVSLVQFEPLTGRVLVQFSGDASGYNATALTNPANYSFSVIQTPVKLPPVGTSRPRAGVILAPTFAVTGVSLSTVNTPGMPQSVVVTINNNQPIRPGSYRFTIHSAGIVDGNGLPLNGAFTGTFPSGEGAQGQGEFAAILTQSHNTVLPARPIGSVPGTPVKGPVRYVPAGHPVRVRYAPAVLGHFRLAGGNNITLIPVGRQYFPGTYRPGKPAKAH